MVAGVGVEPTWLAYEANVWPLDYPATVFEVAVIGPAMTNIVAPARLRNAAVQAWVRCRVYPFTSSFDESHSEAPPLRFPRLQHRMEFLSRQKYVIHL